MGGIRPANFHEAPPVIENEFDERAVADISVALERACEGLPLGGDHKFRTAIADAILDCARSGNTTLGGLTAAGARAASQYLT